MKKNFLPPNSRCQEVLLHLLFLNFTPFAPCLKERGGEILDEVLVLLQDESSEEGGREGGDEVIYPHRPSQHSLFPTFFLLPSCSDLVDYRFCFSGKSSASLWHLGKSIFERGRERRGVMCFPSILFKEIWHADNLSLVTKFLATLSPPFQKIWCPLDKEREDLEGIRYFLHHSGEMKGETAQLFLTLLIIKLYSKRKKTLNFCSFPTFAIF